MIAILNRGFDALGRLPSGIALLLFPFLIFLHNPACLLSPELWAEDGPVWYAQAYQLGFWSLLTPLAGYLNSVQRLTAIAALPLPLSFVPYFFQFVSILIQAAPAILLVSPRMDAAWPHRPSRWLFAVLYLLMPNAPETSAGLTNSQWYLAILAFVVIVSSPPNGFLGRLFETLVLLVAGLSGPFCVLILPTAAWEVFVADRVNRFDAWRRLLTLSAACFVQAMLILFVVGRDVAPLGATFELFVRIIGFVSLGAELGYRVMTKMSGGLPLDTPLLYVAAAGSAVLLAAALIKGPRLMTQYFVFAAGLFALSLAKPVVSQTNPQWQMLLLPPGGNRYFLFAMIAWWGALFVLAGQTVGILRIVSRVLLAITLFFAIPSDWGDLFGFPHTNFLETARAFDQAPPGTTMEFNQWPPGWKFSLTK